jgi:copper oxidase (laccase) domain-containing protein
MALAAAGRLRRAPRGVAHAREAVTALARQLAAAGYDWIVPAWDAPARVGALMTTRAGGVSRGVHASLNLGASVGDDDRAVAENRRRLGALLPSPPRWLGQVHGAEVVVHRAEAAAEAAIADAAVTRERGVVCAVQVADCLPVLLADRDGKAVGIAHAGWRGLAAGVVERTVAALGELGADPGSLAAWLGPCIGPHKWLADLRGLARRRLAACGVRAIAASDACTVADAARFYSWRRDRGGGRMAALVWLAAPAQNGPV